MPLENADCLVPACGHNSIIMAMQLPIIDDGIPQIAKDEISISVRLQAFTKPPFI
jgi:hypothetical protein